MTVRGALVLLRAAQTRDPEIASSVWSTAGRLARSGRATRADVLGYQVGIHGVCAAGIRVGRCVGVRRGVNSPGTAQGDDRRQNEYPDSEHKAPPHSVAGTIITLEPTLGRLVVTLSLSAVNRNGANESTRLARCVVAQGDREERYHLCRSQGSD